MGKTIDELLEMEYWVLNDLPMQVPTNSPGQYFAVEDYYFKEPQFSEIKKKHINVILKLNCYRDISLDEEDTVNPSPEHIAEVMRSRYVCILLGDSMIVSEPDDTNMTLYNPDEKLLELVKILCAGEGLYVWQP